MKTLLLFLALRGVALADAPVIVSPDHMGHNRWTVARDADTYTFSRQMPPGFLLIQDSDLAALRALIAKHSEWNATARKNKVYDYSRELGAVGGYGFLFKVGGNGLPTLVVTHATLKEPLILTDADIPPLTNLLQRVGDLGATKPGDKRDALFR